MNSKNQSKLTSKLYSKMENDTNELCNKFINAFKECVYSPEYASIVELSLGLNVVEFDIRQCLKNNSGKLNQVVLEQTKFDVDFVPDIDYIGGNEYRTYPYDISSSRKIIIQLFKNDSDNIFKKKTDFKFIVS